MNTKIRGLRLNDDDWKGLQRLSYMVGYSDVTALIRAIARDELVVSKAVPMKAPNNPKVLRSQPTQSTADHTLPFPQATITEPSPGKQQLAYPAEAADDDPTYDKDFDWGA